MSSPDRYEQLYREFRWQVPARFNLGWNCCGQWAADRTRFALYWEDESGEARAYTFSDIQQAANRLSNALIALGVTRGERVAILLPQRPETAIAYIAIFQMGAIALPLSHLFGPEALEYRMQDSEACAAIVEPATIANLLAVKDRLPALRRVIGVGDALEAGVSRWDDLLAKADSRFTCLDTGAEDSALIVYTSGTTGPPKGALKAHRVLLGNVPGFVHSHDFFPQPGDMFWSPADWAWTGGLMDALLPTWHFGQPILGYRGRFDAERAYYLIEKYGVRNAFLFPTALKLMMKAVPEPRKRYRIDLRSIMSAGESVGVTVIEWAREHLGVTINEMFGQTEINYVVGNCQAAWPVKPGAIGRPYPGHRVAIIDGEGGEVPRGDLGEIAVQRAVNGVPDPVFFREYWKNPKATTEKFIGDWGCTGDQGRMDEDGYIWYQGRSDDVIKSSGYRIGPAEIESCLVKHPAVANAAVIGKPDAARGALIKAFIVLQPGQAPSPQLEEDIRNHVRARLAPYEYPREIEFIEALPMTTTGKVQRKELRLREEAKLRDGSR
ncbi:MAG: AMP-binding protein [Betaproteobacteria bacterium]|nr:AMP-binding protein [Betaproteobacteria bacterium]